MNQPDPKALGVARATQKVEQPELTILFGSRARGDHDEQSRHRRHVGPRP